MIALDWRWGREVELEDANAVRYSRREGQER